MVQALAFHAVQARRPCRGSALGVEEVERRALGHEQDGLELQLPLHRKVLHRQRVLRAAGTRVTACPALAIELDCCRPRPALS